MSRKKIKNGKVKTTLEVDDKSSFSYYTNSVKAILSDPWPLLSSQILSQLFLT